MFCFHMPAFSWGKYVYVDTYLWPCIVSYPLFMKRNFVVCGHVASMGGGGNEKYICTILVRKHQGKRPLGRPRRRREDNIKMHLR
jgi:hypothetical protein